MGDNITEFCAAILVDAERLESARDFNPKHLGYITNKFKNNSDHRFHIWATNKYKEVAEFIKKLYICDKDFMQPEELITYAYLVQEAMSEYCNIVN